jgi:hypothetical protein
LPLPGRITLTLVALAALALGVWRFGNEGASPALDAAFVAMTVLVLVLGIREWVRVLQRSPRLFDPALPRVQRVPKR